jgi:predicted O-methyltransferase YrrM
MEQRQDMQTFVRAANGMLPLPVYGELFNQALDAAGTNFVEVGTAHGAATISLALGAATRRIPTKIWTIDKLGGKFSSRSKFGSVEENRRVVLENFRRAGVDEMIELFVGSPDDFILAGRCPECVDLLLLDADGRIDRDLMHFYSRMRPGGPIIIDDVNTQIYLGRDHEGVPYIDLKHRIASLLLAAYEEAGFIRVMKRLEYTAFCQRGEREYNSSAFSQIALSCYRELVFADTPDNFWLELAAWSENATDVRDALRMRTAMPPLVRKAAEKMWRW